ncbi:hypothetical protein NH340_JMT03240 [Sarcoptes scabiei]|nr:hypothetical protein NH340_JMT03240 [Sarcoptes scabiei]
MTYANFRFELLQCYYFHYFCTECERFYFIDSLFFNLLTGDGNVNAVRISSCQTTDPCRIPLGSNVSVEIDFFAPFDATALTETIKGLFRNQEIPFRRKFDDLCRTESIEPQCPLSQGKMYRFKARFEVKAFYRPVNHHIIT